MSVVRYVGSMTKYDKWLGTSPFVGAVRGARMGYKYGKWVKKMGKLSSDYRSYRGTFGGIAGRYGSAPRLTGSANRVVGSAPETALKVMGDMPSEGIRRRKTSRIY